ncbi:MAG: hypothetical protein QM675_03305 [Protaetiibacter sp.]
MIRRSRISLVIVAAVAAALALTACSSDEPVTSDESSASQETESDTQATEGADPTEDAADDGKPTKEEVVAGYKELITAQMDGLPEEAVDEATRCIVDEIYDDASAQTLQALADGDATGIDVNDVSLFTDAQTACTEAMTAG